MPAAPRPEVCFARGWALGGAPSASSSSPPRVRMWCFHHAGGNGALFNQWIQGGHFPPHYDVRAIELPGRGRRAGKDCHTRMASLVEELAEAIAPAMREAPSVFFGHSLGALVAFELARELRRRARRGGEGGEEAWPSPRHLVVSARGAPHIGLDALGVPAVHTIEGDDAFVDAMVEHYQSPDLRKVVQVPQLRGPALRCLRADMAVFETYVPLPLPDAGVEGAEGASEPPLACSITAYAGEDDAGSSLESVKAWQAHTSGSFVFRTFKGGHFYWRPDASELIQALVLEVDMKVAMGDI